MQKYLEAALKQMEKANSKGELAGRAFHEFAAFCDQQLTSPNNIEDYERALKLRENKRAEMLEAQRLMLADPNDRGLKSFADKAGRWLKLDDEEFSRLKLNREAFLEKSISNYLQCLAVSEDHNQDAVRFCALWFQHSANENANQAVDSVIDRVASRKFVPLLNQLSSRLADDNSAFQTILYNLMTRICRQHPYHGLHHILTATKHEQLQAAAKVEPHRSGRARTTLSSRGKIAQKIKDSLLNQGVVVAKIMINLEKAIGVYMKIATFKIATPKGKGKVPIRTAFARDLGLASSIERGLPYLELPPPTMDIEIRADNNYDQVPKLVKFCTELTIAGGVSTPKILTCTDTSGRQFKMLVSTYIWLINISA